MKIKNETEIQLLKIFFKTSGGRATKNITSKRAYPYGLERKYYNQLKSFFAPLTKYVNKYISENMEPLLRGDSEEIRLDAIPGDSFRNMIYNLENWLSLYMPDISEVEGDNNNVILTSLGKTANEAIEFGDKEFSKTLEKGINVSLPTSAEWWDDMKNSWMEDNYTLITSNAKNYVSKINTLTEQAIVNGMSPKKLKEEIFKATESLSDKHCKLLARDQMGKLNGQITQAQMQEIGLDLYVWSTSADDRVRDSHALMEGLLCRWDDASVCSYDNGKTWEPRPSGAVELHPGQDIQCRCIGLAFYPELVSEIEGTPMNEITEDLPPVQDVIEVSEGSLEKYVEDFEKDVIKDLTSSEKKAFDDYSLAGYNAVNDYLRNKEIIYNDEKYAKKIIKKLDDAFKKSKPFDIDLKLYRGEWTNNDYSVNYKKGEKINLKSFISTSLNKNSMKNGNVEYEIIVPKNKNAGIYINSLSFNKNEKEFLLNRNMWYEVLESRTLEDGRKKITLKFLGDSK